MRSIVRISDGLGNQMFQYAFAYSIAQRTGEDVLLDPLFWGTSLRRYQLEEFNIEYKKRLVSKAKDYVLGFGPRNGRRYKEKYRQYLIRKKYYLVNENKEELNFNMVSADKAVYYVGFWQTPKYFDDYYEELKRQFTRKKDISLEAKNILRQIESKVSVALHIRRTDYVRQEGNVALFLDFYKEALLRMEEQIGDFQLYIFTDDKIFVKNEFHLRNYILAENVSDLDEFELMRSCKHHIIANSTFSWWAAYLGENKGGIVYAPRTGIWTDNFYLEGWNLLDAITE